QQLLFPSPPEVQSREWLQALGYEPAQVNAALVETGGRPLAARALLEEGGLPDRQRRAAELDALLQGQSPVLALAERWLEPPWEALLTWLQARVAAALRQRMGGGADSSQEPLARLEPPALFALLDRIHQLQAQTRAGTNPNRQLALESLL